MFQGGRVRAPAPTAYPKVRLFFVGPDAPIGPFPGGPVCRPYEWRNPLGRAGEGTRPYEMGESSGSAVGADDLGGPRAAFGRLPHPSGLRPATFP